jgi:hypothetical protein
MGRAQFTDSLRTEYEDVLASRDLNPVQTDFTHVYQNTSNAAMLVMVTCLMNMPTAALNSCLITAAIGTTSSPGDNVQFTGFTGNQTAVVMAEMRALIFIVPRGYYYRVYKLLTGVGNTIVKFDWQEVTL